MSMSSEPGASTAKLCECGCGEPTRIARQDDPRHGHVKGQGVRFIKAHHHRGKTVSAATRAKISAAVSGEKSGHWKGDSASYRRMHTVVCESYPKVGICEECGQPAHTEYALIHGRVPSRTRSDYMELCRKCHMHYDLSGERGPRAKLAWVQVEEIRRLAAAGRSYALLAGDYGVSKSAIGAIVRHRTWASGAGSSAPGIRGRAGSA